MHRLAAVSSALTLAGAFAGVSATPAPAAQLPPGCNLGVVGQTLDAIAGTPQTFQFEGYNAVPPGHAAKNVRIAWGDGTTSRGAATARRAPVVKGCYDTLFTGRHTYARVTCQAGVCSTLYDVTVTYVDARTGARHKLTKLQVDVLRRNK